MSLLPFDSRVLSARRELRVEIGLIDDGGDF